MRKHIIYRKISFILFFVLANSILYSQHRVYTDGYPECQNLRGDALTACNKRVGPKYERKRKLAEKAKQDENNRKQAELKRKREIEAKKRKLEQEKLNREQERERREREANRKFIQIELPPTSKSSGVDSNEKSLGEEKEIDNNSHKEEQAKFEAATNHARWLGEQKANADNAYKSGNYYEASKTYEMLGDSEGVMKSNIGMAGQVIDDMFPGRTEAQIKKLRELKKSVYSEEVTGNLVNGLAPKRNKKGWYGYINSSGEWIIKPKYIRASEFKNGSANVVTKTGKKVKINTKGKKQ